MTVQGFISSVVVALVSCAAPALAQQSCAPRDALVDHLGARYQEEQIAGGLRSSTELVEVWRSEQGSWTILVTDARGFACILAAGSDWREVAPPVELSGIQG